MLILAKFKKYQIDNEEEICAIGKAISSPVRLKILQLLYKKSLIIGEIAKILDIPASSTAFHLKILEEAGLVRMEEQPGTRGSTKLCSRKLDSISVQFNKDDTDVKETFSMEMPIGMYSECRVVPTCGLFGPEGIIGSEDQEHSFFLPDRGKAEILWSSAGYVEYRFANGLQQKEDIKRLWLSMEICSEAPGYKEDWKSDITVWINGVDCGTWTSMGDYGERRGRLTRDIWPNGGTQYGKLVSWEVKKDGCYINGDRVRDVTMDALDLMGKPYVTVRIGNKPEAEYIGGFNLFGKHFGDYEQDIIFSLEY